MTVVGWGNNASDEKMNPTYTCGALGFVPCRLSQWILDPGACRVVLQLPRLPWALTCIILVDTWRSMRYVCRRVFCFQRLGSLVVYRSCFHATTLTLKTLRSKRIASLSRCYTCVSFPVVCEVVVTSTGFAMRLKSLHKCRFRVVHTALFLVCLLCRFDNR
jgi:hypothetical protein